MRTVTLSILIFLVALFASASCGVYKSPPIPTIAGENQGILSDPSQPLVIDFSKPIDLNTLQVKVVRFEPNADGQLADETGDPTVSLDPLFERSLIDGDLGGTGTLDPTGMHYTITPTARFPVGPKLAVLIEPGLADAAHDDTGTTAVRKRLLFSYSFTCSGKGSSVLTSGNYFFLLDVEEPVGTQIKVFANLNVDASTGRFVGQYTFAQRLVDPNRCSPACENGNVCKTLPGPPTCVVPSERAGTTSEWPDFFPNNTPPLGYSFTVNGCAEDEPDGTATFASEPANMVVQQPAVQINGLVLIASFSKDASGTLNGSGSVTGDNIVLGNGSLGPGHGTAVAQSLPGDVPPGIPPAPATVAGDD